MARREQYLVGLDVGTSRIAAIVAEVLEDGGLDISGIGVAEARGIRRGAVVNLEVAVESIKKAVEEAELTAGVEIDTVYLSLSGAQAKAFNSRGVVAVAGKNREITREDVYPRHRCRQGRYAAERSRDFARAAAGLRRRRARWHWCAGRYDRYSSGSERPRRDW